MLRRMFSRLKWRFCVRRPTWSGLVVTLVLLILFFYRVIYSGSSRGRRNSKEMLDNLVHLAWRQDSVLELRRGGKVQLSIAMGTYQSHGVDPVTCGIDPLNGEAEVLSQQACREWPTLGKITLRQYVHDEASCFQVLDYNFRGEDKHKASEHCIDVSKTFWYGGAATIPETWPVNLKMSERAHASDSSGTYASVHDRYWFSSNGFGVMVDDEVPLFVSGNGKKFCIKSFFDNQVYTWSEKQTKLNYTVCARKNVKQIYNYMTNRYVRKPIGIPDEKMIKHPVWSTWVKYKSSITQFQTETFMKEIIDHGFPISQLELDDIYTVNYGDYQFDKNKFPNPPAMIKFIHDRGARLTVWTHPFSNKYTDSYLEGQLLGYFVKDRSGEKVGQARWWRGGDAGALDVTNPYAVEWFKKRLMHLRNMGVDGHKFDAGEIGFLPKGFQSYLRLHNPCHYSKYYAESMYNITNNFMQMRVGYKTQHLPIFVSMMDRASSWDSAIGIKSVIPTALIFGSLGYFFVMPDMIGGNAYCGGNMDCMDNLPEKELYIRWVQLAAFLPMMQFSIPPWQYDKEVVDISRSCVTLHAYYVSPLVTELALSSMVTGNPIIRPMWWLAPEDEVAMKIDSQFMIGDVVLVAPVLEKGAKYRDIYFPKGVWMDKTENERIVVTESGYILENYAVQLQTIPYFERIREI